MQQAKNEYRLEAGAGLTGLTRIIALLDRLWEEHQLEDGLQADLNISVEEALTNVIRHSGATQDIQMRVEVSPESIAIEIQDDGVPFDPLASPLPDPGMTLEQRRPGGLGIFMLRNLMDQTGYRRENGRNCLTMMKLRKYNGV